MLLKKSLYRFALLLCLPALTFAQQASANGANEETNKPSSPPKIVDQIVITASGREETLGQIASTVQVFDRERIENSTAATVTQFLSDNGIAFFSTWTPAQTSINLRGAASDGQGRDFRSQVTVLINGRRAGTANVSKLSLQDIERIEILRGPSSLLYGSQALGGVINLITKDGVNSEGVFLRVSGGSFGEINSTAQYGFRHGAFDYFFSVHGGRRGDYTSGSDSPQKMLNTAYKQYGGLFALGFNPSNNQRLEFTLRQDGIYDAGFRGSSWDTDNVENRWNQSFEGAYRVSSENKRWNLNSRYYYFKDIDDFRWGAEVVRNAAGNPAPGYTIDDNYRRNTGHGVRVNSNLGLFKGNTLLAGFDQEWWRLDNRRIRMPLPGAANTQVAPFDVNSASRNTGVLLEDAQAFADGRFTLRGGARFDFGRHTIKPTPNLPTLLERSQNYDAVTYRAGATARAAEWLTLKFNTGTGFRAPTPVELAAEFNTVLGGQILGNPNLKPERTVSYDAGAMIAKGRVWIDATVFWNDLTDRIGTVALTAQRSQFVNRNKSQVAGLELQSQTALGSIAQKVAFNLSANGVYHWRLRDLDAAARNLNTDKIERMYKYQGATRLTAAAARWSASLGGTLFGPMYYESEENLLIPQGEPFRTFIHGKNPFWLVDTNFRFKLTRQFTAWTAVNNLLNLNQHPIFIALNRTPIIADVRLSNGGVGNSLPGRAFIVGLDFRWKK
jgi:vitamin B12 transporter